MFNAARKINIHQMRVKHDQNKLNFLKDFGNFFLFVCPGNGACLERRAEAESAHLQTSHHSEFYPVTVFGLQMSKTLTVATK